MTHKRCCRHSKPCVTSACQKQARTKTTNVIPIKGTSMSSLCVALPVLLATRTDCAHTDSGHRRWCVNKKGGVSIVSTGISIYILKYHVPVSSNARHSLHNAPSWTWTFPSLQSNSPKRLDTCLLHSFLCPYLSYQGSTAYRVRWTHSGWADGKE